MAGLLHRFVESQVAASKWIEGRFFPHFAIDGNSSFTDFVSNGVLSGTVVADVGGGKTPFFPPSVVDAMRLTVTGVDIDEQELAQAPIGSYATQVVSAIERVNGKANHDYVLAQSVLEHVRDGEAAARGIGSLAKPGGTVITFCPNRRAWFARLNVVLPEAVKRTILFGIFPNKRERQGFPAFYDGCTPREMRENMGKAGVEDSFVRCYFTSSYFMFFVPLYIVWRLFTYPLMRVWPERYCETFMFVGRKSSYASAENDRR